MCVCVCVCVCVSSILFVVLWISWICDLVSDIIWGNSQSLLLHIVLLFLSCFILLPVFSLHIHYTFVVVHSSWIFCSNFSSSLSIRYFSVLEVSVAVFSAQRCSWFFPSTNEYIKHILHVFYQWFFLISCMYFRFFLKISTCLHTFSICSCIFSIFSIKTLSILITVFKNSWSDNCNSLAISDSDSDTFSFSSTYSYCFLVYFASFFPVVFVERQTWHTG